LGTVNHGCTPRTGGCEAIRKDGQPCRARAQPDSPFCWCHDPALETKRQAARSKGGERTRDRWRVRLSELEERQGPYSGILTALLDVATELRTVGLPSNEVGRLRACVYGLSVALRAVEVSELDSRIEDLSDRLKWVEHRGTF
jgi:hypothetical protein